MIKPHRYNLIKASHEWNLPEIVENVKRFEFNNFQAYIFKITKNWQTERFRYVSFLLFLLALKNKSDTVFVTPNENSPISQHKLATQHIIVSLSTLSF